jgi:hypothetical protein
MFLDWHKPEFFGQDPVTALALESVADLPLINLMLSPASPAAHDYFIGTSRHPSPIMQFIKMLCFVRSAWPAAIILRVVTKLSLAVP